MWQLDGLFRLLTVAKYQNLRTADRIAQQTEEFERLVKQRDALLKK
jgi:hypothetical protein